MPVLFDRDSRQLNQFDSLIRPIKPSSASPSSRAISKILAPASRYYKSWHGRDDVCRRGAEYEEHQRLWQKGRRKRRLGRFARVNMPHVRRLLHSAFRILLVSQRVSIMDAEIKRRLCVRNFPIPAKSFEENFFSLLFARTSRDNGHSRQFWQHLRH